MAGPQYCADCGCKLHFNVNHPHTELQYFNCSNYRGNRGTCNSTHYIRADALEEVVLLELRRMTQFLQDKEEDFVKLLMDKSLQEEQQESKRRENEVAAMIARCHELDALFTKTYEDNASGKLSDERFMMITKRYDDEQIALKKKISAMQAEIDAEKQHKSSTANFLRTVRKYTEIKELTPTIVNELIEKIVVYQAQGTGRSKTQQLETVWTRLTGRFCNWPTWETSTTAAKPIAVHPGKRLPTQLGTVRAKQGNVPEMQ